MSSASSWTICSRIARRCAGSPLTPCRQRLSTDAAPRSGRPAHSSWLTMSAPGRWNRSSRWTSFRIGCWLLRASCGNRKTADLDDGPHRHHGAPLQAPGEETEGGRDRGTPMQSSPPTRRPTGCRPTSSRRKRLQHCTWRDVPFSAAVGGAILGSRPGPPTWAQIAVLPDRGYQTCERCMPTVSLVWGREATEGPRAQIRQTTAEHREGGNCSVASRGRQQRPVRRIVLRSPI